VFGIIKLLLEVLVLANNIMQFVGLINWFEGDKTGKNPDLQGFKQSSLHKL